MDAWRIVIEIGLFVVLVIQWIHVRQLQCTVEDEGRRLADLKGRIDALEFQALLYEQLVRQDAVE